MLLVSSFHLYQSHWKIFIYFRLTCYDVQKLSLRLFALSPNLKTVLFLFWFAHLCAYIQNLMLSSIKDFECNFQSCEFCYISPSSFISSSFLLLSKSVAITSSSKDQLCMISKAGLSYFYLIIREVVSGLNLVDRFSRLSSWGIFASF